MHLKRIEITGFKSFAHPTELEISPGITAVVGPNGSGKSNIVDAIRWVLGEQSSKSLRGTKMEDVIFVGSQTRKPLNYSEVSLTLSNEDGSLPLEFAEVTLTRRLDRSGESQYFINRQPCRLKDITDLLLDTGLGKDAYSIIGQGRIEEILSHRPEDRRGIFEEAAGIVRYRIRRREAEKHLAETEQNIARINDVLHELKQQLEPLERQAEVARQYKQYRQQLEKVEVSLYLFRIQQVHQDWQAAKQKLEELEQKLGTHRSTLAQEEALMADLRQRLQRVEEEMEQLHQEQLHAASDMQRLDGLRDMLRERRRQLAVQKQQAEESHQKAVRQLAELERRMTQFRLTVEEKERAYEEVSLQLHEAETQLQTFNATAAAQKEQAEQLKNEYFELSHRLAQWRNEERFQQQALQTCQERQARLARELEALNEEEETLAEALRRLTDEKRALAQRKEETKRSEDDLRHKETQQRAAMEACQQQLEQLQQRMSQLRSRHEVLREMAQEFSGYSQGAKTILQARNKKRISGVHGAVAELIRVPQELEAAVEAALGGALQHIVVDDEATGRQCILYLKERRAGRATFLPLDVIGKLRPYKEPELPLNLPGLVGLAHRLVQTDERYQPVLESLLGQVVVAEHLEAANRIARETGYRLRVVTLDGDLVHVGGSMTGGSPVARKTSLLGRQRELAELEAALQALTAQEQPLRQQLEEHRTRCQQLRESMALLQEEQAALANHMQQLDLEAARLQGESQRHGQRRAVLEAEQRQLTEEMQEIQQRLQEVAANIQQTNRKAEEIRGLIERLQSAEQQWARQMDELHETIGRLRTEAARLDQQRKHLAEQLQERLASQQAQQEEAEVWRRRIEQLEQQVAKTKQDEAEAEKKRQVCEQRMLAVEQALVQRRDEKRQLDQRLEEAQERLRHVQRQLQQAEAEAQRWTVIANRREVELDHLLSALARDYGISYEWAQAHYPLPDDPTAAEREVAQLKSRIERLGDVNLGAIEEYERLAQRYAFLSGQQADLLSAKATLRDAIRELDEKMAVRFQTTFETIRRHFQDLFASMFGGGQADLVLTDPDDLLHTGIDILVQPPGKRMQPLNLLSGGERAMTAIVLLFAMLRTRPVPFCVLDEVDAALDDANVSRFARQLRRFSQDSQFLVITHRQGTMEEADVLYGVAMQEGGVSEVFSLSLSEAADHVKGKKRMKTGS